MFKRNLLIVSVLTLFLLPTFVYAINIPGWPIVPCGLSSQDDPTTPAIEGACTRCDLFQLLKNLIDFVIGGLMPPLAILLFVWAGFLILLGGANTSLVAQGRQIFTTTFYGIVIMLSAWMITNTLILSIGANYNNAGNWWQFTCTESTSVGPPVVIPPKYSCNQNNQCVVDPTGTYTNSNCDGGCQPIATIKYGCNAQGQCVRDPSGQYTSPVCNNACSLPPGNLAVTTQSILVATQNQSYSQALSATGGIIPYSWSVSGGSLPVGLNLDSLNGVISGTPTTADTSTFTIRVTDSSTPQQSATRQLSVVVSGATTGTLSITTVSLPGGTVNQSYSQQLAVTGGAQPYRFTVSSGTLPVGLTLGLAGGNISGTPTTAGTSTFTVRVTDSSTPQQSATKQLSIVVSSSGTLACIFNGVDYSTFNLCSGQKRPGGCGTSVCSQYLPSIQRYASGAATVDVLKAFMVVESDCNIKAVTGTSYGLMQISPATANPIAYKCGLSPNSITPAWLTDPVNADKSICLGAEIIRSIAAGTCGSQPRNIYAGYNAGPGYCTASNDCAGEQSCGGGVKKKWECPYDNPQHTVCNMGMYQTKQGATYINYCLNNLGF